MRLKSFNIAFMLALSLGAAAQNDVVAHFDMTVGNGNTITESVSGQAFEVEGNFAAENVDGAVGKALRLDGYSSYVNAQIDASKLNNTGLTISLWCAPETYPMMNANEAENAETWIAGNLNEDAKTGFAFTITSQGDYGFKCYMNKWSFEIKAEDKMPCYEWSNLVATIDGTTRTITLYRNGKQVGTARGQNTIGEMGNNFLIGKSSTDRTFDDYLLNTFNGLIDDITIYNRVFTAEEAAMPTPENAADLSIPASRYAGDILRPTFHGMPATAWTNECHGMAYSGGRYHLFFQKNANGPYMARLHWGHIWSENLYKWHEDRIAIAPSEDYDIKGCWSGAVFTDQDITGGKPAIIYTGVDNAKASINMALPDDDNLTYWTKYGSNPLIAERPAGLSDDFRDPYFFTANGKKYMIVGSAKGGIGTTTLHEYNSQTGTWTNYGNIFFGGNNAYVHGTFWEMPTITQIGDKWLFTVTPQNTSNGVEVLYWVGDINDDGTFSPTAQTLNQPGKLELDGFSNDGYGLLSPTIFQHDGKTLLLGIVPDKLPSSENYKLGWAHCYSLPREISLADDGTLIQKPYSGLTAMRTSQSYSKSNFDLTGTESLSPVSGRKVELCGEFEVGSGEFGFNIFKSGDKAVKLSFSPLENMITVNASGIDRIINDGGVYDGVYRSELPRRIQTGEVLKINAFIDHSIMDVFINDTWAFSMRVFPTDENANGIEAFSDGTTHVKTLNAWVLDENQSESSGITSVDAGRDFGLEVKDGALVYDNTYDNAVLTVYDLEGRMLSTSRIGAGRGSLRIAYRGACIARIVTDGNTFSRKIVIR